ncbi:Oxidoreductase [Arthrobacter sp. 9V]|uniref:FAD-dependent monooxygenase n=1 Tax=Arthrobacter sp. 9V TaxID=2653132 RepID=UPI0012F31BCE|nr:FAD-dependent monooxygenase [Arthrobacter sp. 9V]VXB47557.1 Oxidoreductase [Arthrobacter sp. 9V]
MPQEVPTTQDAPSASTNTARTRTALIVGASMAGLSAAAQLSAVGYRTTVVERSPHLRLTGTPIDVRGEALAVAGKMEILEDLRKNRVNSDERPVFTTFVNENGDAVAQLPLEMANDSDDDIEISREALINILHAKTDGTTEFVYRDWPVSITDGETNVVVQFASGEQKTFDIVVGADGIHSSVRRLLIGPESLYRKHLGVYYAIVDLPRSSKGISGESRTFNCPGRMVGINDYGDRSFGVFAYRGPETEYDYRDTTAQKKLLIQAFEAEQGWHIPFLLDAAWEASEIYFDSVSQVHMPRWSQGRVVLVGDAAHAASLFSGRGTSLAIMGAAILAEELHASDHAHGVAFARYESRLRPAVVKAQEGVLEARDFMVPETQDQIDERNRQFPLISLPLA